MRKSLILFVCLLGVVTIAGALQSNEEYSDKQWSNILLLEGKAPTIVNMLMSLPSVPVSIDSSGGTVIHDAYFYRKNDRAGNPNLGALIQISDSSVLTVSIVYNANKKGEK